jgi:hypothetical protein
VTQHPDPLYVPAEEPEGSGLEVPRTWFGLRALVMLTVVVSVLAGLLVIVLYMSPLAAR